MEIYTDDLTVLGLPEYRSRRRLGPLYVEVAIKQSRSSPTRYVATVEDVRYYHEDGRVTRQVPDDWVWAATATKLRLFHVLVTAAVDAGWTLVGLPEPNEYGFDVELEAPVV